MSCEDRKRFIPYKLFVGSFIPNALMRYPDLSPSAKLLWARLAQYAGSDGECYPSQKTLAEDLGLSVSHIKYVLKELRDKGFVTTERSQQERLAGRNSRYYFLWHDVFDDEEGTRYGTSEVSDLEPPEVPDLVPLNKENYKEEERTTKKEREESREENILSLPTNEGVMSDFHRLCPSLPRLRGFTEPRRKAAARIVKESGYSTLLDLFRRAEASDFLTGRAKEWRTGYDWITKPANATKILEGTYDNRTTPTKARKSMNRALEMVEQFEREENHAAI